MKSTLRLITFPVLLAATMAQADVNLALSDGIKLHAVNGEAWSGPGVFDARTPAVLENGINQIVVNMTAELGRSREDSVIERTDSFVLLFQAEDATLELTAPDIGSRTELEAFNEAPSWTLRDTDGNPVDFELDVLEISGFQLIRDYEKEIAKFNRDSGSEAALRIRHQHAMPYSSSPRSMPESDMTEDQEVVWQMLRYWYLKADDNTKSEMKRWIQSGNN